MEKTLPEGIYEQIVNTRLQGYLEKLDPEQYDIDLEAMNADDARKVLTIYMSEVIEQGLRLVREGHGSGEDADALLDQITLCNTIIEDIASYSNEDAVLDSRITEKGEILTALYKKMNSLRAVSAVRAPRPETSILENSLFTGSRNEPSMLHELKKELASSDRADLLVSFIKWSAIRVLMPELKQFTARDDVKLRIIATTYVRATDYKAVEELAKLPHTEVKINYDTSHARLHAKSYFFYRKTGFSTAYIGSSNLSSPALTGGLEWNVKVTEKESFDILQKFSASFESYWNDPSFETFDPDSPACREKLRRKLAPPEKKGTLHRLQLTFRPYAYQQEILDRLDAERRVYGRNRNLVAAATGTGKTIIAAFDYKRFAEERRKEGKPARLLFVAHRKEILEQSLEKFREVLNDFNFGSLLVGGYTPDDGIDQLFISIQSFNSSRLAEKTSSDFYDFIIVDEFHHAAAKSYQTLLSHYNPEILLGLTATPQRMDGKDILQYFGGRIAAEISLGEAIDRGLLSTFQYFGIADTVDYRNVKWINGRYDVHELENLYVYTADQKRASLILQSLQRYCTDIAAIKGLGFCVSVRHAEYMADYFTKQGIPSISLSAESPNDIRDRAKNNLTSGKINFIFVVDLYNEGVDIPEVNTVLFLRPTESANVFIQQLGRGLRLSKGKDCLTVLDFVGQADRHYNYSMKFRAMTGRRRKSVQKQVEEGFADLPRGCCIQLEKKARDYILENIRQQGTGKARLVEHVRTFEEDFGMPLNLENFLAAYDLSLKEFYKSNGSISMHRLKIAAGLTEDTRDVNDGVYRRLRGLLHVNSKRLLEFWTAYLEEGRRPENECERKMRNMLYYTFYQTSPEKQGFSSCDEGIEVLLKENFVLEEVLEVLHYNLAHINFVAEENEYTFVCPLDVHCRYNKNQILAAFGYYNETSAPGFREGVKYFADLKTDIFLINLNKSEKEFSPSTMYEDYAISASLFHWQSQSRDKEKSAKIQRYIHHRENGGNISLFVREFKTENGYTMPYVFLGNADYVSHSGEMPVSFNWHLHSPIPADLLPDANKTIAM
ncbi:MAG: DUF3427 domain-containing protein [Eubacterium sp.]